MNRDLARMRRLDELLDVALDGSPEERSALLKTIDGEDPTLALELKQLLAAAEKDDPLLDGKPWARLEPQLGTSHAAGDAIGPYRLQRLLGTGGMGEVWLAHNEAGIDVALKLIRSHLSQAVLSERLRRERDILMRLKHPNIARLLDSGLSVVGEPYLIIEYVDGQPLLDAAHAAGIDVRGRVRWMHAICEAVAAAQAQLVIHRDIKPANVLVDRTGLPKLLDFGIAKLLDSSGFGGSTELTHALGGALTPAYAAPEQLRGEPVSTASDVYALGVVLHELLVQQRPQRDGENLLAPSRVALRASDPSVRQRARELRGDLDAILERALQTDPAQRYPNAQSLAEELIAWLEGQPVRAREGAAYRLVKLIARNRVASIAIALGLIASTVGAIGAWQQSHIARREAQRAAYVQSFLEDLFANELPGAPRDELPSTAELLERGTQQALADLDAEPGARLSLLLSLARIQVGQRQWAAAKRSFEAARALLPEITDAEAWRGAAIDADLATVQTQLEPGDHMRGVDALQSAVAQARAQGAPDDWLIGKLMELIAANVDSNRGDTARAQADELLVLVARFAPGSDREISALTQAVVAYSHDQIFRPQAEAHARRALELASALFGEEHAETAYASMRVAGVLRIKGDIAAALPFSERAASVARRAYPAEHPQLARILEELARIRIRSDPNADTTALWREVLAIREHVYGLHSFAAARSRAFLATSLIRTQRYSEAAAEALRAVSDLKREVGPMHPAYLDAVSYAVTALTEEGRSAEALALLPAYDAHPPKEIAGPSRWRFFELVAARLRLEPNAVALQRLIGVLAAESHAPRDVASLCLSIAAMAIEQQAFDSARAALDAANTRIAKDDSTKLSEIAALLSAFVDGPKVNRADLRAARDIVAARRGDRHYAVRLADNILYAPLE